MRLPRQQLTAVNAQMLLQVVFVLEGLETLGALELARPPRLRHPPRRRLGDLALQTERKRGG